MFRDLDSNNDGHFNSYELRNALNSVGMLQLLLLPMMMMMMMTMMMMIRVGLRAKKLTGRHCSF